MIFNELEEKIRSLAQEHALLKKRNAELEEQLRIKTSELEELNTAIKDFDEERIAIRTKVDSLLELLQDVKVHR
jgi:chromosome segregation ATPase